MRASTVSTSLVISVLTTVSASPFPAQRFPISSITSTTELPASVTGSQTLPELQKRLSSEDVLCAYLELSAPSLATVCASTTLRTLSSFTTTAWNSSTTLNGGQPTASVSLSSSTVTPLSPSVSFNSGQPTASGSPITSLTSYPSTITGCNPTPSCKSLPNSEIACGADTDNPDAMYCTCNNGCSYTATVTGVDANNGICAWSGTPTGPPMTVDCTSPPQAAITECPLPLWNLTADNWVDANVDGELSSWFLNLNTDAPTAISKGSYPTKLPPINTGPSAGDTFGVGYVGKFISAAAGGLGTDCTMIIGGNMADCHPPTSVQDACGNVPRWAYLAWTGLWNMVYINAQIYSILESMDTDKFAQSTQLEQSFSVPYKNDNELTTEILLSVIGALGVIVGVLMPLGAIGGVSTATITKADAQALTRHGSDQPLSGGVGIPRSPSQPEVPAKPPRSGSGSGSADATPPSGDAPVGGAPSGEGGSGAGPDATVTVTTGQRTSIGGKVGNKQFLGNALFIAPATLVNLGNTAWADIRPQPDPDQLVQTIQVNIQAYFSALKNITQWNNQYLTSSSTDPEVLTTLLQVILWNGALSSVSNRKADIGPYSNIQALGAFVNPQWNFVIYENLVSADVIAREINGLWRTSSATTYISYTFLDDDVNATKCLGPTPASTSTALAGDTDGAPSTKYCADAGVYYLNRLDFTSAGGQPKLMPPYGFDTLLSFGMLPWWPASGSAKAYRALNPDSSQTPVYDTAAAEAAYNNYIIEYSTKFPDDLIDLVGQNPGTWNLPVCDQGSNSWTYDWSNSGGLESPSPVNLNAFPCACGYQGTGTANFYTALGIEGSDLQKVVGYCEEMLVNVAPGMPLTTKQNIGWNAIVGGPPKSIVYGPSLTITAPTSIPTSLCYSDGSMIFYGEDCQNEPPPSPKSNQITNNHGLA